MKSKLKLYLAELDGGGTYVAFNAPSLSTAKRMITSEYGEDDGGIPVKLLKSEDLPLLKKKMGYSSTIKDQKEFSAGRAYFYDRGFEGDIFPWTKKSVSMLPKVSK
jgi:hypothetical protein